MTGGLARPGLPLGSRSLIRNRKNDSLKKRRIHGLPAGATVLAVRYRLVADPFHFAVEDHAASTGWTEHYKRRTRSR